MELLKHIRGQWVRYDAYEIKEDASGQRYVTPAPDARPEIFDPMQNANAMVIDALNIGLKCMNHKNEMEIEAAVMAFVANYGLLGLMTALPTTPDFMDYESVYFMKNQFIKEETLPVKDYVDLFFPFEKLSLTKKTAESRWNITDPTMIALAMTMQDKPMAVSMGFQREYAERYDWLIRQFKDWAFIFSGCYFYNQDKDSADAQTLELYRKGMAAFDGIAPSYHIALLDKPTLIWDFQSLQRMIQMTLSLMLTDDEHALRMCKHCGKAFVAGRTNTLFCSPQCKNQHNVYKSRAKAKELT